MMKWTPLLFLLTFFLSDFHLFQLTLVISYALALLGANILTGYNGQVSLGFSAFFAVGAYTSALLMSQWHMPFLLTVPCAAFICFLIGVLLGIPVCRMEGLFLPIATLGCALAVPQVILYLSPWTGGSLGISITKPSFPIFSNDQWLFVLGLSLALFIFWGCRNFLNGRVGRAMMAIRDNPIAAETMGIHVPYYKVVSFGISSMILGIAGSLAAVTLSYIDPSLFSLELTIYFQAGIIIGGIGTLMGAVYGSFFIMFLPNIIEQFSHGAPMLISGVIIILLIYFMPKGLAGLLHR